MELSIVPKNTNFFIRKILLVKYSYAFVVMPGGFGTLDEFYEAITLVQTKKIEGFPIIIFNREYHKELLEHNERLIKEGTISATDPDLYLVTDSIEEAVNYIKEKSIVAFKLQYAKAPKPLSAFFEKSLKKVSSILPK